MGKISLRSYNREIDQLIKSGLTREAIAHCNYILKQFPKHIDTYRLLGQAYLDSKDYPEAQDVFLRILAAVPDDFLSHLGMSIIHGEENNLDAAIWHMERAFEVQPANTAIQEELRQLYGRRDGSTPQRVRLTRGALVRMYARGELYQQAIAEARSALAEEPGRQDLQAILARLYFLHGENIEAAELCSQILKKSPYCLEANHILAEIVPNTSRAQDAKIYTQRIIALDPYNAFLSPSVNSSSQVADSAVTLEHFEWQPTLEDQAQSVWAQPTGVELENSGEALPDWIEPIEPLDRFSEQAADQEPPAMGKVEAEIESESPQTKELSPSDQALLPDWMKAAGWSEAVDSFDNHEELLSETDTTDEEISVSAIAADVPDWLKEIAPIEEAEPGEHIDQAEIVAEEELSGKETQTKTPEGVFVQEPPKASASEEPCFQETPEAIVFEETPETKASELETTSGEPALAIPTSGDEGAPLELSNAEILAMDEASQGEGNTTLESDLEMPSDVRPAESTPMQAETGQPTEEIDLDSAFAWLENLAARQGADDATLLLKPEDRQESPPAWVTAEEEAGVASETEESEAPGDKAPFSTLEEPILPTQQSTQSHENAQVESTMGWVEEHPGEVKPEPVDWHFEEERPFASTATETTSESNDWFEENAVETETGIETSEELSSPSDFVESDWVQADQASTSPVSPVDTRPLQASSLAASEIESDETLSGSVEMAPAGDQPVEPAATPRFDHPEPAVENYQVEEPSGEDLLSMAQKDIQTGDLPSAQANFNESMLQGYDIEKIIDALLKAVDRCPNEPPLWELLGDAHLKANHLQEALSAYAKAEELLR